MSTPQALMSITVPFGMFAKTLGFVLLILMHVRWAGFDDTERYTR